MRLIDELVPDVTIAAPGAPPFVVMHAISRSVAEFLSSSEAWREWSFPVDPEAIVAADGVWDFVNSEDPVDAADFLWQRTKRVEMIEWGDEQCTLEFKTTRQLSNIDREWRTRSDTTPDFFTQESGASGGLVRFVAIPDGDDYGDLLVTARLVIITNVVSGMGTTALDAQIPQLPDYIFENYRENIVAGALAILYAIPGKDWTALNQVAWQRSRFDQGVNVAKSAAASDYGHPVYVTSYGGI